MAKKKTTPKFTPDSQHGGGYVEVGHPHLAERLDLLKTVLYKRAARKDCASIHIDVKPDGTATIAATDLRVSIQLRLDVLSHTGSGLVMIDATALDAMLGAYAEPRVRIHLDDVGVIRVEGQRTKLKLPGYDPAKEMKLTAPGPLTADGWVVRADALVSAIKRTRFCTDEQTTRYPLGGLALYFPADPGVGWMAVAATDGRRLAEVRIPVRAHGKAPLVRWQPCDRKAGHHPSAGIPIVDGKAVKALLKVAQAAGDSSLGFAVLPGKPVDLNGKEYVPGKVQVVTREAVLTADCPEGNFPDYKVVFPGGETTLVFSVPEAHRLGALLATAVAACDSEHKGVDITAAGGCVMIESGSLVKGRTQVTLTEVEMSGRGSFTVDGLWFRQFFDAAADAPLTVKVYGPKDAVLCQAGPDYDFLIMPLTRDGYKPSPKPEPASAKPEPPKGEDEGGSAPPEPPVPAGVTPDAHKGNGKAKTAK